MAKTFEVIYQAAGSTTGLTVQCDVYKSDHTKDDTQSGTMTEIGTTGRYYKSFDADAADWSVQCSDPNGGKATKAFGKAAYDSHGVAQLVANIQTAVDNISSAIGVLQTTITGIETTVEEIDTETEGLTTAMTALTAQLTLVEDKIDALESPPMIG